MPVSLKSIAGVNAPFPGHPTTLDRDTKLADDRSVKILSLAHNGGKLGPFNFLICFHLFAFSFVFTVKRSIVYSPILVKNYPLSFLTNF